MRSLKPLAVIATLSSAVAAAHAGAVGPTTYLQASDSPFAGLSFDYFHLENFEDHALNTPGVTASSGGPTSVVFGPSVHDSVDADDGAIDGSGLAGDSWFGSGATGVRFEFNEAILGGLPTHAGLVWTDGAGTITFEAFGPGGVSLGTIGPVGDVMFPDPFVNGETAEDRFFGFTNAAGISAILLSNSSGGIELDHVQYGGASDVVIPPPAGVPLPPAVLMAVAPLLGAIGIAKRRRRGA